MGRDTPRFTDAQGVVPTVHNHTRYKNGVRLHTIDPDPDRDIDVFDDDRPARFVGEEPDDD